MSEADTTPALARTLKRRHVTMITLGGVIGAGLFVGSSAAIASIGPAVVISYALAGAIVLIVMRVIAALAVAACRHLHRICPCRAGPLGRFHRWLALLVFLGGGDRHRGNRRGRYRRALG